jgi:outer membrane protein OmpA-like peptidoglycan-associated protein
MHRYDYARALTILKKAAEKDKYRNEVIPMLAECYRQQRDVFNAKAWYQQAVSLLGAKPEVLLYYAQALQETGEYNAAKNMFLNYSKQSPKGQLFAAHCDSVLGPWKNCKPSAEVKNVPNINTSGSDFGAAIYNDMLIFASDFTKNPVDNNPYGWTGRGYLDIKKSSPVIKNDFMSDMSLPLPFSPKLNQMFHDGPACFSPDGNIVYFTRSYKGKAKKENGIKTNQLKIFYSEKIAGGWSVPRAFIYNSPDYSVGHPALSPNGNTLYYISDMPGGEGGTDIWMCKKEGESWSEPFNLGNTINTSENEMFPYASDDGTLYFASEGHPGYGALDIFSSKFENGKWSVPANLKAPINSSFDDFALAFVPGTKNGFFSSNRPGGQGNDDIYSFKLIEYEPEPVIPETPKQEYISGVIRDKVTMQPLEGATAFVYNTRTGDVIVVKTDPDGHYEIPVNDPDEYIIKGMKSTYIADCLSLNVSETDNITKNESRDLLLDKLALNRTFRIDNIYYDFDKYNIRDDALPELDKLVRIMKENPINVELGSHTDSRGSFSYNDRLSQNRANSAVAYIVSQGIDKNRITAKGYGEHQLVNKCADGVDCTEEEHQANRRTEFKIIEYSSPQQQVGQFNPDVYTNGMKLNSSDLPADFFKPCK